MSSTDETEGIRRFLVGVINDGVESAEPDLERKRLIDLYGADNVWDYKEVGDHFEITGFLAPFCTATRKSDGKKGVLTFQHHPRFYFDFMPDL